MIFETKTTPNIEPDLALAETVGAIVVCVNNVHNHRSGNIRMLLTGDLDRFESLSDGRRPTHGIYTLNINCLPAMPPNYCRMHNTQLIGHNNTSTFYYGQL